MRIGFSLNKAQQKLIAAYLLILIVWLLWRIDDHLARIEAPHHREAMRRRRRHDPAPVGVRDRHEEDSEFDEETDDLDVELDELVQDVEEPA